MNRQYQVKMVSRSARAIGRFALSLLASVALAAACTGVSNIGSGDQPLGKSGGASANRGGQTSAIVAGAGGERPIEAGGGAGAPALGGESNEAGAAGAATSGGGAGGDGPSGPCTRDEDCPELDVPCESCSDGSYACEKRHCDAGACVRSVETCHDQCQTQRDCPTLGRACTKCDDGSAACPSSYCQLGRCQLSFPTCDANPCDGAPCGMQCKCTGAGCTPGVLTYCGADGLCEPGLPQCGADVVCRTAQDCGDGPPNCVACSTNTCAAYECSPEGRCIFKCPPNPHPDCQRDSDCPLSSRVCQVCPLGDCSREACVNGSCERVCAAE